MTAATVLPAAPPSRPLPAAGATAARPRALTAVPVPAADRDDHTLPRLRCLPVPAREPRPAMRIRVRDMSPPIPATQGTLALAVPAPAAEIATPSTGDAADVPPQHREWAVTFVHAAMEVAAGVRSPAQLVRWTGLDVQAMLIRRGALAARARRGAPQPVAKPVVRSLRMCSPRDGVYEATAVVAADRIRAVALRMEDQDGRWRVMALEIG
jgi:hypothetical protein